MDPIAQMYKTRDEEGRNAVRSYRKPPQRFRASELSDCKRKVYYRLAGYVPAPRTGFSDDWSMDGDVHHDIVRQQLLNYGVRLAGITVNDDGSTEEDRFITHEITTETGRKVVVSTRQDGWIYYEPFGWMLMEIKTVGHWVYKYMLDAYEEGGHDALLAYIQEKYPNYIYQMTAGMKIAQDLGPSKLPFPFGETFTLGQAALVIKDRSNCHIGFHSRIHSDVCGIVRVPFQDEVWEKIVHRLDIVKGSVSDGEPPRAEYISSSKQCGYCAYRYLCHDADKRRKQGRVPAVQYPDPKVAIHFTDG